MEIESPPVLATFVPFFAILSPESKLQQQYLAQPPTDVDKRDCCCLALSPAISFLALPGRLLAQALRLATLSFAPIWLAPTNLN